MSNSPPSSALAAEGKTNASKHPQSHASKSIFLSQREKNTSPSSYPPDLIVNVCDREQQQSTVLSPCAGVLRSATRGKDPLSPLKKTPAQLSSDAGLRSPGFPRTAPRRKSLPLSLGLIAVCRVWLETQIFRISFKSAGFLLC